MSLADAFGAVMSVEELPADGKARVEREFTYYAKLVDESQLEKATSREDQEQWSIRVAPSDTVTFAGELRVRRCEKPGEQPRYILTSKTFKVGDFGKVESETEVSEDMFLQFRKLSNSGMIKTRYCFERADGLVWEVDVYKSPDGTRVPWVKIDLEVKDDREPPRDFPVDLTEVIGGDPRTRTEIERKQVGEILDNHFVLKNQYPKGQSLSTEGLFTAKAPNGYDEVYCRPRIGQRDVDVLDRLYRATFMRPAWVESRGVRTDQVAFTGLYDLADNGVIPNDVIGLVHSHLAEVSKYINTQVELSHKLAEDTPVSPKSERAMKSLTLDPNKIFKSPFNNLLWVNNHGKKPSNQVKSWPSHIRPMTAAEVPQYAKLVLDVIDTYRKLSQRLEEMHPDARDVGIEVYPGDVLHIDQFIKPVLGSLRGLEQGLRRWLQHTMK